MITCPSCGTQLQDGLKFCANCGKQIPENTFCMNCGAKVGAGDVFCQSCGAPTGTGQGSAVNSEPVTSKPKVNILKKALMFGGIGVAAIVVLILATSLLGGGKGKSNYGLYIKDGEIYYNTLSGKESWQVTERLVKEDELEAMDLAAEAYTINTYCTMSEDGKILFFPDKISGDDDGCSLYYRYINKPKKDAERIDSDIITYMVNEAGNLVTYLTSGGSLYQHDLKEKEKVASHVSEFRVSGDGKKIIYMSTEDDLYLVESGKDKEKLEGEIGSISYVTEDFSTVYYMKKGDLYKQELGKDREKIDSNVELLLNAYDTGELYYLKSHSAADSLMDHVEDDMAEADASVTKPVYPSKPYWWEYDTTAEYNVAYAEYERAREVYEATIDAYYEKQSREELRDELRNETWERDEYTLYYYDGKEEVEVTDTFAFYSWGVATEVPVLAFSMYEDNAMDKIKFSEITSAYDVEIMIQEARAEAARQYIALGAEVTQLEQEGAKSFKVDSQGKNVYFLSDISEDDCGDLYKIKISGKKVGEAKLYDSDVYTTYFNYEEGEKLVYFKDVEGYEGDLYINKEEVDKDVRIGNFSYAGETETLIYIQDWDSEDLCGTLKTWKNGKTKEIAEDVYRYQLMPKEQILYLCDYSTKYYEGELYLYKNGKAKKVDDDVVTLLAIYDTKYKGEGYYYSW